MKRERKFRAWDIEKKQMMYSGMDEYACVGLDNDNSVWSPTDCILMDWSGLNDEADQDIYEGDILRIDDDGDVSFSAVKFDGGALYVDFERDNYSMIAVGWLPDYVQVNVMGNIYQNPELLDEKA